MGGWRGLPLPGRVTMLYELLFPLRTAFSPFRVFQSEHVGALVMPGGADQPRRRLGTPQVKQCFDNRAKVSF